MKNIFVIFALMFILFACSDSESSASTGQPQNPATPQTAAAQPLTGKDQKLTAARAAEAVVIDGKADEAVWKNAEWQPLDQLWVGAMPSADDFQGRFKTAWAADYLYVLAEIQDDTLVDIEPDGLLNYWDDDCLEIFVDADASGGNHTYSHNAFAYHLSLDGKAVDINPDTVFTYYNDHVKQARSQTGKTTTWEVAVKIYADTYRDNAENTPLKLAAGEKIGFALAYCDNDYSKEREHFMGSVFIPGEDKNKGWIDADVFGELRFAE